MSQQQRPEFGDTYRQLRSVADLAYGAARADELDDQLRHLSEMMDGVSEQQLALTESPLEQLPRQDGSGQ